MKTRNKEDNLKELTGCLKTIVGAILTIGSFVAIVFLFYALIGLIHGPIPEPIVNTINMDYRFVKNELYICPKSTKDPIPIKLNGWRSIGGFRSSDEGINLIFTSPTFNTEVCILPPCKPNWDDEIKINPKNIDDTLSITVPTLFPTELFSIPNKDIRCSVRGDLTYLVTIVRGVRFQSTTKHIAKEINVHIISDSSYIAMQDSITNDYKNKLKIEKMEFRTSGMWTKIFLAFGFLVVSIILTVKFRD